MKYHAHMKFRVKESSLSGLGGKIGEIVATDFGFDETQIDIDGETYVFRNDEIELFDHENCDAPPCRKECEVTR